MKFENIIPDIRKGRKFRRASWAAGEYLFFERDVPDWGDVLTDQNGCSENYFGFELDWIIEEYDDWELVLEKKKHVRWIGLFSDGDISTHDKQEHVYRYAELYSKKMEPLKSPALVEVRKIEWESE